MNRQIIKGFRIEYSEKNTPVIDNTLREFMGSVFVEFNRLEKLRGDSMNIILVQEEPTRVYNVILCENENPMHKVRFDNFMKKICKLAEISKCLPDKLIINQMVTHKTYHPELRDGEIYLGNFDDYTHIGWKTKRAGLIAYDIYGKEINSLNRMFPIFVQRKELEDAGIDIRNLVNVE